MSKNIPLSQREINVLKSHRPMTEAQVQDELLAAAKRDVRASIITALTFVASTIAISLLAHYLLGSIGGVIGVAMLYSWAFWTMRLMVMPRRSHKEQLLEQIQPLDASSIRRIFETLEFYPEISPYLGQWMQAQGDILRQRDKNVIDSISPGVETIRAYNLIKHKLNHKPPAMEDAMGSEEKLGGEY